ncbi:hypothetical protein JOF56_000908 [Kibdelosporangium banguiense]|uniref:DUF559 domain-containing protein n=1 Tax=Kibdelosporangium banguiense TaxID=1365924 RepID=A0ABS4T7X6_9PSEU|nr:hypothetical protein [Kibdelosporangium banguiense]MBP2320523.1 hypothetical protein [Kibdelosporangium banguiense]
MGYFKGRSIGRYQAQCSPTFCVAESGAGTSSVERDLFTLLRQVFSRGEQPYEVSGRKSDMGFHLESGLTIVVEYDGAYWHTGHEDRDWRKSEMIMAEPGHRVIRLREEPLELLHDLDLHVPKRADGPRCATLAIPHLAHTFYEELMDVGLEQTLGHLTMVNKPRPDDLTCKVCQDYVEYVEHSFPHSLPPIYWPHPRRLTRRGRRRT